MIKPIKKPQILAMIAFAFCIVYFIVATHSSELLIYDLKVAALAILFAGVVFLPDRFYRFLLIPFWAYPLLSIIEIVQESQYYSSYFSDYIVEYSIEFALFIFAGFLLLGTGRNSRGLRIIVTVLLVLFGITVLYKSLWYFVLGDTGYLSTYLFFSIPEAFSALCIQSYSKSLNEPLK